MNWMNKLTKKSSGQNKKMGNTNSTCSLNHSHRSKLESAVCEILRLRELAGEIKILQVEDHLYLSLARIGYVADFKCLDVATNKEFWVEAKGFANDRWPMKKKLYKFYGPGALQIWTGDYRRPVLSETIVPVSQ